MVLSERSTESRVGALRMSGPTAAGGVLLVLVCAAFQLVEETGDGIGRPVIPGRRIRIMHLLVVQLERGAEFYVSLGWSPRREKNSNKKGQLSRVRRRF
jgi:hypothetical protein